MEDVIYFNELYDFYGSLLTEKQREYFENYYFNNLSLGEMADLYSVSRNAIYKQLKITTDKLQYYEDNLKLREKSLKLAKLAEKCVDSNLKEEIHNVL